MAARRVGDSHGHGTRSSLPGFYYDSEKNRYFRLPPSHFAHLPQFGHISAKSHEQKLEEQQPSPQTCPERGRGTSSTAEGRLGKHPRSLFGFATARQQQITLQELPTTSFYETFACCAVNKWTAGHGLPNSMAVNYTDFAVNDTGDLIACWWNEINSQFTYLDVLQVTLDRQSGLLDYRYVLDGAMSYCGCRPQPGERLGFHSDSTGNSFLLSVAPSNVICYPVLKSNDGFITLGSTFSLDDRLCHNFGNAICTASWNHNPDTWSQYSAAVGLETGEVYIIAGICQLERRVIWCRSRKKSSVFSVAFSGKSPLLFTGTRNGTIAGWDLRSSERPSSAVTIAEPKHGDVCSSVIGLHPLTDDNFIISNAFNSQLSMWDLRMRRPVLRFLGHSNSFRKCKSVVGGDESLLVVGGDDDRVRVWSLRTATLLRTITPDEYCHQNREDNGYTPPIACFSGGEDVCDPTLMIAGSEPPDRIAIFKL